MRPLLTDRYGFIFLPTRQGGFFLRASRLSPDGELGEHVELIGEMVSIFPVPALPEICGALGLHPCQRRGSG